MPRPPDQPQVQEDAAENRARDSRTIGELFEEARRDGQTDFSFPTEPIDYDAIIERIGPQRWAELRGRRDSILARLREQREGED